MKNSQKQNVIININNEVKTKRKRRYKRNNNVMIQQTPQTTAYNPNVLVKSNTTPSYGLKSVNPVIPTTDNSVLSNLLINSLKQPEPNRDQYIPQMTPIKQEPITPEIKREITSPISPIRPMRPFPKVEEEEITPAPTPTNNINQFRVNPNLQKKGHIPDMTNFTDELKKQFTYPSEQPNEFSNQPIVQRFHEYQREQQRLASERLKPRAKTNENVIVEPAFSLDKGIGIKNVIRGLVSSSNDIPKDIPKETIPPAPKKVQNVNVFPIEKPQIDQTAQTSSMLPVTQYWKNLLVTPPREAAFKASDKYSEIPTTENKLNKSKLLSVYLPPAKTNEISDIKSSDLHPAPEIEGYLDFLPPNLAKTQTNEISTQTFTRAVGNQPKYRTLGKLLKRIKEITDIPIAKRTDKEKEDLYVLQERQRKKDYELE